MVPVTCGNVPCRRLAERVWRRAGRPPLSRSCDRCVRLFRRAQLSCLRPRIAPAHVARGAEWSRAMVGVLAAWVMGSPVLAVLVGRMVSAADRAEGVQR